MDSEFNNLTGAMNGVENEPGAPRGLRELQPVSGVELTPAARSVREFSICHSQVAAQLVEAAYRARAGDCETAKAFIARAVAMLRSEPSPIPTGISPQDRGVHEMVRGGLAAWQKRRLVTYIDMRLADRIRVEELAALLKLSESHFSRAFRRAFGTSAHNYLTRRRIEMAQGLMLTSGETLSGIALRCGLSDQSHFTRLFRRIVGETPYAWRRARRGELEDRSTEQLRDAATSRVSNSMGMQLRRAPQG